MYIVKGPLSPRIAFLSTTKYWIESFLLAVDIGHPTGLGECPWVFIVHDFYCADVNDSKLVFGALVLCMFRKVQTKS
jgi:hypothetical protein